RRCQHADAPLLRQHRFAAREPCGSQQRGATLRPRRPAATPADPVLGARVQAAIARLHENVNMFWDCGDEAFRGLGDLYVTDPRFRATFARMDERMPEFLQQAMSLYCDRRAAAE